MMHVKAAFVLIVLAVVMAQAKPSHPFGFHGVPDHLDFVPPVLPPAHFHAPQSAPLFPHEHARFLPPPPAHFHAEVPAPLPHGHLYAAAPVAPLLPPAHFHATAPAQLLPAPAPVFSAPAPLLPAPAPLLPAAAPLLPAPAPLLPAPIVHTHTHVIPAPAPILPPVFEAIPFAQPIPSYRAIPGPKTTAHHVSVGYAFPQPHFDKVLLAKHHHHHTLF